VVTELPVGVFITTMPRRLAAGMSTLSTPMVDVVDADARAADDPQPMRFLDDPRSNLGCGADDEPVVLSDDATELILTHAGAKLELDTAGLTQDPETRLGEFVRHENTYVGHGYSYGIRP
jgi:hypothetical protein